MSYTKRAENRRFSIPSTPDDTADDHPQPTADSDTAL